MVDPLLNFLEYAFYAIKSSVARVDSGDRRKGAEAMDAMGVKS